MEGSAALIENGEDTTLRSLREVLGIVHVVEDHPHHANQHDQESHKGQDRVDIDLATLAG